MQNMTRLIKYVHSLVHPIICPRNLLLKSSRWAGRCLSTTSCKREVSRNFLEIIEKHFFTISKIILRRRNECGWQERRKETPILKVGALRVYLACSLLLETWAIVVKMPVRLSKQKRSEQKLFNNATSATRRKPVVAIAFDKVTCKGERINHRGSISL